MKTEKILFITNIEHLQISQDLERGEKVGDRFRLTNNSSVIHGLITPVFRFSAGGLEASYLEKTGAIAYAVEEHQPLADDDAAQAFLLRRLAEVHIFFHMLWLVKDNSVNVELGYLQHPYATSPRSRVSRISFARANSTALGEVVPTHFSREELREARKAFGFLSPDDIILRPQSATLETSRLERAFYFLQAARGASDLGVKISNYCTCFEALFSTDAQELAHKLAERIACFLEPELANRLELYRAVKKAYGIRSKVVHGVAGSPRLRETLKNTASVCDEVARKVLVRILSDSTHRKQFMTEGGEDRMEEYLLSLVLGPPIK